MRLTTRGQRLTHWAAGLTAAVVLAVVVPTVVGLVAPVVDVVAPLFLPVVGAAGVVAAAAGFTYRPDGR